MFSTVQKFSKYSSLILFANKITLQYVHPLSVVYADVLERMDVWELSFESLSILFVLHDVGPLVYSYLRKATEG